MLPPANLRQQRLEDEEVVATDEDNLDSTAGVSPQALSREDAAEAPTKNDDAVRGFVVHFPTFLTSGMMRATNSGGSVVRQARRCRWAQRPSPPPRRGGQCDGHWPPILQL
jgi:hypothetical protein